MQDRIVRRAAAWLGGLTIAGVVLLTPALASADATTAIIRSQTRTLTTAIQQQTRQALVPIPVAAPRPAVQQQPVIAPRKVQAF